MPRVFLCILLSSVSGCSGGSSIAPLTSNVAPIFTSAVTASMFENSAAAIDITASDADADAVTFSVSGGEDAAFFQITATGSLSFKSAPNFELPLDADSDNVYRVSLTAGDGKANTSANIAVTILNDSEGIKIRRIGYGFTDITDISEIPGDDDIFITERGGKISRYNPSTGAISLDRTLNNVNASGEGGLLGLAVAPEFANSNIYWAFVTAQSSGPFGSASKDITIRSILRSSIELPQGSGTILTIAHDSDFNYGGGIAFDALGDLYVATGDAGLASNAQDSLSQSGKILRFRRNPDPFAGATPNYFIAPQGNLFASNLGDPFIYAMGVHNPTGFALSNGTFTFGDGGQSTIEEVNILAAQATGENFGWPFFEGSTNITATNLTNLSTPFTQYQTGTGQRQGMDVLGGINYQGAIASLQNKYIFADRSTGSIWAIPNQSLSGTIITNSNVYERVNSDFIPDIGILGNLVAIGQNSNGAMFIADNTGQLFAIEQG